MDTLSIIVPVYNVDKYLSTCVDSLLEQGDIEYEIILVDDGSWDNSGNICDEYALKDNRIRVIHQKNGGVNHARNVGIDNSTGGFITFVDADDEIEPETFKLNMDVLFSHPDIDILQYPEKHCKLGVVTVRNNTPIRPLSYTDKKELFLNWYHSDSVIPGGIWGKIYKKVVFDNYRFPEDIHFCEDQYCIPDFLDRIGCLYMSVAGGYLYHFREGSASNSSYTPEKCLDVCRMRMRMYQTLYSFGGLELEKARYFVIVLRSLFYACIAIGFKDQYIQSFIDYLNTHKAPLVKRLDTKEKGWILLTRYVRVSWLVIMYAKSVRLRLKLKK